MLFKLGFAHTAIQSSFTCVTLLSHAWFHTIVYNTNDSKILFIEIKLFVLLTGLPPDRLERKALIEET